MTSPLFDFVIHTAGHLQSSSLGITSCAFKYSTYSCPEHQPTATFSLSIQYFPHCGLLTGTMSTPTSGGTFPFLAFPPELRNTVYRFCSPQSTRFVVGGSKCMRAPEEEGDCQTIAGIEHETTTSSEQNADPVGPTTSAHTDLRSSLPQLLRTCRQIHNEAKALLYNNNCFQIHFREGLQAIPPESRKEIRHMVLSLFYINPYFHDPEHEAGRYIETWAELLSGLSSLQLIVADSFPGRNLDEWEKVLKMHLEFIDQHIPPHVKVEVDTDGDESTRQLVNDNISNLCTFEQLVARNEFFERGMFAWIDPDFDLDLDWDDRIDSDGPDYYLYYQFY